MYGGGAGIAAGFIWTCRRRAYGRGQRRCGDGRWLMARLRFGAARVLVIYGLQRKRWWLFVGWALVILDVWWWIGSPEKDWALVWVLEVVLVVEWLGKGWAALARDVERERDFGRTKGQHRREQGRIGQAGLRSTRGRRCENLASWAFTAERSSGSTAMEVLVSIDLSTGSRRSWTDRGHNLWNSWQRYRYPS
ncbi:hypothetical protein M0R45_016163 [Rubus argutus]|uniref:Uncharacterized protein n=1 Tax=Rubus argutus TaxID=59490 RepID=A0AAW1XSL6_RUBAR